MAMYSVYDNILMKLENVFLRVEMEVDREITSRLAEHSKLKQQLADLKDKSEVLNSLKRSFELYCDKENGLQDFKKSLFKVLCEKQMRVRFLQEKELLVNSHLLSSSSGLPSLIQLNREFKMRKKILEIELLSTFLMEDTRSAMLLGEIERANEIFDLALESGANDKLESMILVFEHFFEKTLNLYEVDKGLIDDFKEFKAQILLQANGVTLFVHSAVDSVDNLQNLYKSIQEEHISLENEVQKLLFQFTMLHNGIKIICLELKNLSGELESILFKEYAIKQKIQELRLYKIELNNQKNSFMKDPTIDGYTEALHQLEAVENRFKRLIMHKTFDKPVLNSSLFLANKIKTQDKLQQEVNTSYHKILFQTLHNSHISSEDKLIILRLSKPTKLITSHSGKFFYQRASKTRSLQNIQDTFRKLQTQELH